MKAEQITGPLSAGEWEALIFQAPDQVKALVLRLAVHHGAMKKDAGGPCPLCGKNEPDVREVAAS